MGFGAGRPRRRWVAVTVATVSVVVTTGCTGRGGGQLPSDALFSGPASFGFSFSCEDAGGTNPSTGRLRIQLSYTDHGTSPSARAPFAVHGTVDRIDPVLESMICIGQEPPPGGNELIFLGRYRPKGTPLPEGLSTCPTQETATSPLCRFEVVVRDNDGNGAPSARDFFSIKLSASTALSSQLPAAVPYARAGLLASGNLTVD